MVDSLSKLETIKFKKDISGFEKYNDFLNELLLNSIDKELFNENIYTGNNKIYMHELNRLKKHIEYELKNNNKRMDMLS